MGKVSRAWKLRWNTNRLSGSDLVPSTAQVVGSGAEKDRLRPVWRGFQTEQSVSEALLARDAAGLQY